MNRGLRRRVARETALLLYSGLEKEYLQAKRRAATSLNVDFLPSNREVAEELDSIAEDLEGSERRARLIDLRETALSLMEVIEAFLPRLVGSVWRGTANRMSDIDIRVSCKDHREIERRLEESGYGVLRTVRRLKEISDEGSTKVYYHIYLKPSQNIEAELVVSEGAEPDETGICEIYGDRVTGLRTEELRRVLEEDPLRRFLPK